MRYLTGVGSEAVLLCIVLSSGLLCFGYCDLCSVIALMILKFMALLRFPVWCYDFQNSLISSLCKISGIFLKKFNIKKIKALSEHL